MKTLLKPRLLPAEKIKALTNTFEKVMLSVVCFLALFSCGDDNPDPAQMNQTAPPTQAAAAIIFSDLTSNSITISWTNGNGSGRMVLIKESGSVDAVPINGESYTANTMFGTGDELGTGNFAVFNGSSNSVTVTGLNALSEYHFAIYDYNGSGVDIQYLLTAKAEASQSTTEAETLIGSWLFGAAGAQLSSVLTFIDDTNYMIVDDGVADDGGQPGMERGTYSWDMITGALTANANTDTNGDWGLAEGDISFPIIVSISGDILNFSAADESTQLSKIKLSQNNPLIGSWLASTAEASDGWVLTFIDSVNYMIGTGTNPLPGAEPGMERGTYTWDVNSGAFTASALSDTNGNAPFSPLFVNNSTLTVGQDSLFITVGSGDPGFSIRIE